MKFLSRMVLCAVAALIFLSPAAAQMGGHANVTPRNCSGTITAGGTAQNAIANSSTLRGFIITNIDTTEPMWVSFTGTAAADTPGSFMIQAASATVQGGSFASPFGFGTNLAVSVVAATTGHKFSCICW